MLPLIFLRVRNLILNPRKMTRVLLSLLLFLYFVTVSLLYFVEINKPDANVKNYGDSMWLTAITFATVGYGDRFAVTGWGRIITILSCIGGITLYTGLLSAILTALSLLVQRAQAGELGVQVKNHAIICNWHDEEGPILIKELIAGMTPIQKIVVVSSGERPLEDSDHVQWVCGEPSKENVLQRANIQQAAAIICFPPQQEVLREAENADALSLMLAVTVGATAPNIRRGVFLQREENRKLFEAVGVNSLINSNRLGAKLMAKALEDPGTEGVVEELVAYDMGNSFFRTTIPPKGFVSWGSLSSFCRTQGWLAVSIVRGEEKIVNPSDETTLEAGDEMIVIATSRPVIE